MGQNSLLLDLCPSSPIQALSQSGEKTPRAPSTQATADLTPAFHTPVTPLTLAPQEPRSSGAEGRLSVETCVVT